MARGSLRIYLGAAPASARPRDAQRGPARHERGTDVVVGYVETHNRPGPPSRSATSRGSRGRRRAPRTRVRGDGHRCRPRRSPTVALVDELAHTNVPGSRNDKRWQDVEELLEAGIEIISTVNIQHLESLNDVVEGITGIHQQETIPDAVVRPAEQIELVDMTPEALRRRMAHGNIYAPDKVDTALAQLLPRGQPHGPA